MYTLNCIFEDIVNTSCSKVLIKVYDEHNAMVIKGFVPTVDVHDILENEKFTIHNTSCGIQMETTFQVHEVIGKRIISDIQDNR